MGAGTTGERVSILEEQVEKLQLSQDRLSAAIETQVKEHQALKNWLKMVLVAVASSSVFGEPGKAVLKILSGGM